MSDRLRIVPFAAWHLAALDLRPWDAQAFHGFNRLEIGEALVGSEHCATILADHWPAVVWWAEEFTAGVVCVTMATSRRAEAFKKGLHRISREILCRIFEHPRCRRIEANVIAGNQQGARWLLSHGFEFEGTRRAYFPKSDAWLYGKVKSCL